MIEITDIINDKELILKYGRDAAIHHPENFGVHFEKRLDNYVAFHIVKWKEQIVAMSGIYRHDDWPADLYRVGDRSFYFPEFRTKGLNYLLPNDKEEIRNLNSETLIPMQTNLVLTKFEGRPFYSMLNHPNALQKSVNLYNAISTHYYVVLDDLYWTCPCAVAENDRCWQHVAALEQHSLNFDLPKRTDYDA